MRIALRSGAVVPLSVLLPNVLWALFATGQAAQSLAPPLALDVAESIGRAAILALPLFFSLHFDRAYSRPTAAVAVAALAFYYAAWARFFVEGQAPQLLGAPLLGMPIPLAVAPVVFLLASSYLMDSWLVFGTATLFGVAHIWVSILTLAPRPGV